MRDIAIDTNAYSAFKRGDEELVRVMRHAPRLLMSVVVLGELLAGFAAGTKDAANRAELSRFLASPRLQVVPLGAVTADVYASIYAALRQRGTPIPSNDLWIAASALEHGAALLSLDMHFVQVAGLRVGQRKEDFLL